MTKSILLVLALSEFEVIGWLERTVKGISHQKAYVAPLHLATIAALTPADRYTVQIWDEAVQGSAETLLDAGYDLVGITGYSTELERGLLIADAFRARGIPVVLGGAGITADPEAGRGRADAIFIGEAEETWPKFLADFEAGCIAETYKSATRLDMALSPLPCWDSIAHLMAGSYKSASVQTNRGCPHDCEFCDVWIQFGRDIRCKPVHRIMDEIAALERIGMTRVLFATDNFIGNQKHAKEVLRALGPLNNSFRQPLAFTAEVTMLVARDAEMLRLMAEAHFTGVFIGIESTSLESLRETRKRQNMRGNLVEQIRRIQSYGMAVVGSMIVGFDSDEAEVFDTQLQFLQDACIPVPRLNVLRAYAGTDLYTRLAREGRLIDLRRTFPDDPLSGMPMRSNVIFQRMSRAEVYAGYLRLMEGVWNWENFRARVIGFIDNLTNLPERPADERLTRIGESLRGVMHGIPGADVAIIDDIYDYTRRQMPSRLWNVATLVMMQCFEAARLPAARAALGRQIELEHRLEQAPELLTLQSGPVEALAVA
jgi:radical SAM superfamily enzyme YgiQ (UPF0313 family)